LFEDVTSRAGIHFKHINGEPMRYPFLQTIGGGCAFLDYDGDGFQDILLLSCGDFGPSSAVPNLALYHNNGHGGFTDVTAGSGLDLHIGYAQGVAVGDYDNDGRPDVFVAGYGGCRLFHDLIKPTTGTQVGEYDGDGRLDLFICHYAVWSPETDKKCFKPDGTPMLCVPLIYSGDTGSLYHNEGGGRFRDVTVETGIGRVHGRQLAAAWIDFDGDGKEDLFVANDLDPNFLFRNNGNRTFKEVALEAGVAYGGEGAASSGMGVALGDYDHSGRESLFVPNLNGQVYALYRNSGKGTFDYATDRAGLTMATMAHSGWGAAFLDFDRDGHPDLVSANGHVNPMLDPRGVVQYREPMGLYHNDGRGRFDDYSDKSGALARRRASRGLATGDFDNDGRLDILCINRNDSVELFRNVSKDNNHWISLQLTGVHGNRDGAGTKVWVTAAGVRRYAECRLGSSYASSSDKRLFFGLGQASSVVKLELEWPGGARDSYSSLKTDKFYASTEGRGYVAR
jgi:hypothetical protein